ncbi:hypothetical protein L1987_10872 [Smallanthus sonchifolius]|uniref:Uncharacterized protein n=1 Tax=Smallanthus sonchifolius TaxID=185202 RepID=A0ACB9JBZ7_9ASTR|nr:hypothetical protein L1987_10872 [Smallanthus sonchifolius]
MAYVDHAFSISDEDIMMESDSVYTEDEKRDGDGEGDNEVLTVDLTLMQALLHVCTALSLKPSIEWIAATSDLEDESAKLISVIEISRLVRGNQWTHVHNLQNAVLLLLYTFMKVLPFGLK